MKKLILSVAAVLAAGAAGAAEVMPLADNVRVEQPVVKLFESKRPAEAERLFVSEAVEAEIARVQAVLTHPKLRWMFANCFPNTLDTTVHHRTDAEGRPDTFVYTGDIHAMWLRDSGAQVYPYVQLAARDEKLRELLAGVIRRQIKCILIDPYANAFNDDGVTGGEWQTDRTQMKPQLHERKWEIDSLCYPIRLAYHYWRVTGDASVFDDDWVRAVELVVRTFRDQQRRDGRGAYRFQRRTERGTDTMINDGWGAPVNPVGLIASAFRPSDDSTTLLFLVPSNFFAVSVLRKAAEITERVNGRGDVAAECRALADEVEGALREYAVVEHPEYGEIYAFEVDGFGTHFLMDDANVPSLLALDYLCGGVIDEDIYRNTRRYVLGGSNPYFFRGTAGEGIGGPHIGYDMIWPMSIVMRAMTAESDEEIRMCVQMLVDTDGGTGFMHESFHKDNPERFTRSWFAWANTLFGELVLRLVDEGKVDLLNSIE